MANRRKTIVINRPFQYQQALLSVTLAILLLNFLLIVQMLFPGSSPRLDSSFIYSIAAIEILLMITVWRSSLRSSHRIAGPVYVFTRELVKLGEGDLTANIRLRKKDMFIEESEKIQESLVKLRERVADMQQATAQIAETSPGSEEREQAISSLCEQVNAFRLSTGQS